MKKTGEEVGGGRRGKEDVDGDIGIAGNLKFEK